MPELREGETYQRNEDGHPVYPGAHRLPGLRQDAALNSIKVFIKEGG
jgi:hypothetical protein